MMDDWRTEHLLGERTRDMPDFRNRYHPGRPSRALPAALAPELQPQRGSDAGGTAGFCADIAPAVRLSGFHNVLDSTAALRQRGR